MVIGERLRALRVERKISQGDIEKRTGLLRCYISRVENGHTVPAVETLEKLSKALDTPLYQLVYERIEQGEVSRPAGKGAKNDYGWGTRNKEGRELAQFQGLLSRIEEPDRDLLLLMAQKLFRSHGGRCKQ